jgi:hypothetical protein
MASLCKSKCCQLHVSISHDANYADWERHWKHHGSESCYDGAVCDFWEELASRFKDNEKVSFGIKNEVRRVLRVPLSVSL